MKIGPTQEIEGIHTNDYAADYNVCTADCSCIYVASNWTNSDIVHCTCTQLYWVYIINGYHVCTLRTQGFSVGGWLCGLAIFHIGAYTLVFIFLSNVHYYMIIVREKVFLTN